VSMGTADFVVGVDKNLWVGFGLLKNCNSLFGTQGAVLGGKTFDHTDWVALPDDAAGCSSTLVDWGSTDLHHRIGLQNVWRVSPISRQV